MTHVDGTSPRMMTFSSDCRDIWEKALQKKTSKNAKMTLENILIFHLSKITITIIFHLGRGASKRNQPMTEKKIQKIHLDVMLVFLKLSSTHHNHKNLISKGSHSSTDFRRMRKKKRLRLYPESRQSCVNQETARWSNRAQCLTPCPQIGRLVNRSCPLCSRGRARLRS